MYKALLFPILAIFALSYANAQEDKHVNSKEFSDELF